jgi:hypothetical protein
MVTAKRRRRRHLIAAAGAVAVVAAVLTFGGSVALAHVPYNPGWTDPHSGWPPVPYGYDQIVGVFGPVCNGDMSANQIQWYAYSSNTYYPVNYHRKLGPAGGSQNLANNVAGHFYYSGAHDDVKHGIWGSSCRKIAGTNKWSSHAWGIAVDQNSAYEPTRSPCNTRTITQRMVNIWTSHNWTWGQSFCDPMHFQYARNY